MSVKVKGLIKVSSRKSFDGKSYSTYQYKGVKIKKFPQKVRFQTQTWTGKSYPLTVFHNVFEYKTIKEAIKNIDEFFVENQNYAVKNGILLFNFPQEELSKR